LPLFFPLQRVSRTSSAPQRDFTVMTFKDDSAIQAPPSRSDASVHRPKARHLRTNSHLTISDTTAGGNASPPAVEAAETPPTAESTPPADGSKKHKKHKKSSKLKVKEPHITRERSNDVVLVLPSQAAPTTAPIPATTSPPSSLSVSPSSPSSLAAVESAAAPQVPALSLNTPGGATASTS